MALHSGYQHPVVRKWQCSRSDFNGYNLVYPVFVRYADSRLTFTSL